MFISMALYSLLACQKSKYIVKNFRLNIKKYVTQFHSSPVPHVGNFENLGTLDLRPVVTLPTMTQEGPSCHCDANSIQHYFMTLLKL